MADVNPKVMEMIRAELEKNPDTSNAELLDKATSIDSSVGDLTARQFNARYPLQVKRAMKPTRRRSKRARPSKAPSGGSRKRRSGASDKGRDQVRAVLLELAREVASAEGKGDIVDVVMGIDRYVDRVVKATA